MIRLNPVVSPSLNPPQVHSTLPHYTPSITPFLCCDQDCLYFLGTGKTLSIICSALQWLLDQREKPKKAATVSVGDEEEPDWMRDFVVDVPEKKSVTVRKKNDRFRFKGNWGVSKRDCRDSGGKVCDEGGDEDDEFLVEKYESDVDEKLKRKSGSWSSSDDEDEEGEERVVEVVPKVYFCSRTHSQLSQFIKEFKRTSFVNEIGLVCLGSRKNLCINPEVLNLKYANRINERCIDLQNNKNKKDSRTKIKDSHGRIRRTKSSSGCPMLSKNCEAKQFKDELFLDAMDIEDLVQLGNHLGTCPYYGTRSMVPIAQLVVLPYQSLLMKSARESLSLNLKESVLIIDEAHNLADSITSMYNSKITLSQLKQVFSHLEHYLNRFKTCLGPGNRRYIQTLMVLINSFKQILLSEKDGTSHVIVSMTINEFLFSLDIDNINLVKLQRYIKQSNIIYKVTGYGNKLQSLEIEDSLHIGGQNLNLQGSAISGFQALVDILISLSNNDPDGRMIVSKQQLSSQVEEGYIKFVMLSADKIFSEILDEVHAVVLTGGTLQPVEEARMRLFPGLLSNKIHFFSCNHIVPPENILPITVSRGPSGINFDFSYNSRSSPSMMDELGRFLCNLVTVVPEGIVVFFSSFEYERKVYEAWSASGILEKISKRKHIFREPKSNTDIEDVLKEYKETILKCENASKDDPGPHGALFLAVVGGKVSEGINFSDGMGRCVVMVGLPYPSPSDVELMERIKHIDKIDEPLSHSFAKPLSNMVYSNNSIKSGFDVLRNCKHQGKEYYNNLCMKAVNQSIGRAIRHKNDYAAILLVDSRYLSDSSKISSSHPTDKLPVWIKDHLVFANKNYGQVHRLLHQFFKANRQRECS